MKSISKSLAVFSLTLGTIVGLSGYANAAPGAFFQQYGDQYGDRYGSIGSIVDRTQSDLSAASDLEHFKGDQQERFQNAQKHLSTFDRHLVKGKFDKGELDRAIDTVKAILDKNTLQARSRDALMRDIQELRDARARRY